MKNISNIYLRLFAQVLFYAAGGALIAIGVVFALRSNLGLSTWDTLHYALHKFVTKFLFNLTIGEATIVVAVLFTLVIMYLNRKIKYIAMGIPIWYVGRLIDYFDLDLLVNFTPTDMAIRIICFIVALVSLTLGGTLLIVSGFPAGVFDEFTLSIMRIFKTNNLARTRVIIELIAVLVAIIISILAGEGLGALSIGTIIFALSVGPILKILLTFFERIGLYETEQVD